jgi:hypothetical protein
MNEQEAIVRKLAERGPWTNTYDGIVGCMFCDSLYPACAKAENHNPACLWRRSRALYPSEAAGEGLTR